MTKLLDEIKAAITYLEALHGCDIEFCVQSDGSSGFCAWAEKGQPVIEPHPFDDKEYFSKRLTEDGGLT